VNEVVVLEKSFELQPQHTPIIAIRRAVSTHILFDQVFEFGVKDRSEVMVLEKDGSDDKSCVEAELAKCPLSWV